MCNLTKLIISMKYYMLDSPSGWIPLGKFQTKKKKSAVFMHKLKEINGSHMLNSGHISLICSGFLMEFGWGHPLCQRSAFCYLCQNLLKTEEVKSLWKLQFVDWAADYTEYSYLKRNAKPTHQRCLLQWAYFNSLSPFPSLIQCHAAFPHIAWCWPDCVCTE